MSRPSINVLLSALGVSPQASTGGALTTYSPIDGELIAQVHATPIDEVAVTAERAHAAYLRWRQLPAPQRGELVRLLGDELRSHKQALGELVTLEVGKVTSEGLGRCRR